MAPEAVADGGQFTVTCDKDVVMVGKEVVTCDDGNLTVLPVCLVPGN